MCSSHRTKQDRCALSPPCNVSWDCTETTNPAEGRSSFPLVHAGAAYLHSAPGPLWPLRQPGRWFRSTAPKQAHLTFCADWTMASRCGFSCTPGNCSQERAGAAWRGRVGERQLSPHGQGRWLCTGRTQCRAAALCSSLSWSRKRNPRAPATARRPAMPMMPSLQPPGAAALPRREIVP